MGLEEIAVWLRKHSCYAKQEGKPCGHKACQTATQLADNLDSGNGSLNLEGVARYVWQKLCAASQGGEGCNHPGCKIAKDILDQVATRMAA